TGEIGGSFFLLETACYRKSSIRIKAHLRLHFGVKPTSAKGVLILTWSGFARWRIREVDGAMDPTSRRIPSQPAWRCWPFTWSWNHLRMPFAAAGDFWSAVKAATAATSRRVRVRRHFGRPPSFYLPNQPWGLDRERCGY